MKLFQAQRGMGFMSWVICIGLAGFIILLMMRLLPIYIENYNVKSSLKALQEDTSISISKITVPIEIAFRNNLMKHFLINGISSAGVNNITVKKVTNGLQVQVIYDAKTHIVGNIDAICHFDESVIVQPK
jgi:hypothetical protein